MGAGGANWPFSIEMVVTVASGNATLKTGFIENDMVDGNM
jgi:hypothetical protein